MRFSDHHSILRTSADDWFDPILAVDTKLFVDPFLVFQDDDAAWAGSHDEIIAHFQMAFDLLAGGLDRTSLAYRSALRMMRYPEPAETCLGYASGSTRGSGGGSELARLMVGAMGDAIARGVTELRHFEQLGILNEGIGPDRISDITCTILKPRLIRYTQSIAGPRGVPLELHTLRAGAFDASRFGFVNAKVELPTNPATGGPLLLLPERFLKDLPAINADDWWESSRATELRDELNAEIVGKVRKRDIVNQARRRPELVEAWVREREGEAAAAYDLRGDPKGVYRWAEETRRFTRRNPVTLPHATNEASFAEVIDLIVARFRHFIEESGGWKLLWDGDHDKPEEAAQLIFLGIAKAYCEANGIVVDREVELGRGPVDFKFSSGFERRALLEVKKVENSKFWNGLERQVPSYLRSDGHGDGWYLAVRLRGGEKWDRRQSELRKRVAATAKKLGLDLRYGIVDARPKKSASKLDEAPGAGEGVA